MNDLSSYYDSHKYSDITVRTSKKRIKAHKVILALKSSWFRDGFEREPEGTSIGYINLTSEDPDVVETALKFIYDVESPIEETHPNPIIFCIKLTALAENWGLIALVSSVRAAFLGFARCLWDGQNNSVSKAVMDSLYGAPCTKELVALRRIMLKDCLDRLPILMEQQIFVNVVREIPEFAVDLLRVRAGTKELSVRRKAPFN
ncbi:hypothetical protein KEM54_004328 [Ascosphaera aggregata]|nr:hypothetical protein KEM54_004328 [Ascosphaera aggregata]